MSRITNIKEKITQNIEVLTSNWKGANQTIVFTNGCFDILHRGHIEYLANAADKAERFVVGVNSDESVRALDKGSSRPLQDQDSRALIIAALEFVDAVVIFDEETPYDLISKIQPNVLVKGGDYDVSQTDTNHPTYIVGSDVVKSKGGSVEVIPFVSGYSTSKIEQKIRASK